MFAKRKTLESQRSPLTTVNTEKTIGADARVSASMTYLI